MVVRIGFDNFVTPAGPSDLAEFLTEFHESRKAQRKAKIAGIFKNVAVSAVWVSIGIFLRG